MSDNFQVFSLHSSSQAQLAAKRCEEVRREMIATWELPAKDASWTPKCQIILHGSLKSYLAAVGKGLEATLGSSLVQPNQGVVTSRRIDLRTDVAKCLDDVLPHELCHVLLADRFRDRPAPLWYDEGLALLADAPAKQRLHERDLRAGMHRGVDFKLSELLAAERYPTGERFGVFYGQSASLARFLLTHRPPENLHRFVEQSREIGVNQALRDCYGMGGLPELERRWRADLDRSMEMTVTPVLPVNTLTQSRVTVNYDFAILRD